jgi:DNA-binding transcriptional regulator YbjK
LAESNLADNPPPYPDDAQATADGSAHIGRMDDRDPPAPRIGGLRTRRFDPKRKDRIVEAALSVIAEDGVSGTSLRKIAARADVPLGSMTYHFADMQDLLQTAFGLFARRSLTRLQNRLDQISGTDEASQAILEMIRDDSTENPPHNLTLAGEFQAMVIRDPSCRKLAQDWIMTSTRVLERYFDPPTAGIMEVLIHGFTLRESILTPSPAAALAEDAIRRLIAVPSESAK